MPTHSAPTPVLTENFVWQKDKAEELLRCVNSDNFSNKIAIATNSVDECIDRALREFTGSIFFKLAGVCARNASLEKNPQRW